MLIVLDTTETFADLRMEGANHTLLRSFVSTHPVKLIVPQIVVEETVNHFRESLTEQLNRAQSTMRSLARLIPDGSVNVNVNVDVEAEVTKYREHWQNRMPLVEQPSYEAVNMKAIVQRALARKRPFDQYGKVGFRDALLWETVLQIVQGTTDEVVLITRNKKDFGEHGALHGDLSADLEAKGLSPSKVTICEGLGRFIDEHVKPSLEKLDEIHRQIDEGEFPGFDAIQFFDDWRMAILDALREQVECSDLDRLTHGSVYCYRQPRLGNTVPSATNFQVSDAWRVGESQLSIGIDYLLPGRIDCLKETSIGPHDEPYDEEFSDDVDFTLMMSVVVEQSSGNVESWELNGIEIELTGDWGIPHHYD